MEFTNLAKELWKKKHYSENDNSIDDVITRVANAIASIETDKKEYYETEFYEQLSTMKFIPGGRIYNGAGTKSNFLLNCAVIAVGDSMEEIYDTIKKAAVMFKSNYGVGYNFSKIRPKNAKLSRGGTASGPVSFMKVFDVSGSVVETGGGRRAAQIAILNIQHPDIVEFIDAKREQNVLTQFNISVGITNDFIDAVRNDTDWELKFNGEVYETVKAKDLFNKICESAWKYNDPGLFFIDEVNHFNNGYYIYDINASNPCGELPLPPNGVCALLNINLTKYITGAFTDDIEFDYDEYIKSLKLAVRFVDNVVTYSDYPFEEIKNHVNADRRLGINGISGIGSALAMMKIVYGSEESKAFIENICNIWRDTVYRESIELAKERGSFSYFDKEKHKDANFIKTLPKDIQDAIYTYGVRNVALMTIPPVGTGSLLANNISNGIEPIFALEYERVVRDGNIKRTELVEDYAWGLYKEFTENSKPDIPEYFITSRKLNPKEHIDIQAIAQKYCDGAISKTCNCPESTTLEDFKELFWYAQENHLKGFTTFREGTREGVLSEISETKTEEAPKKVEKIKAIEPKKKRPRVLDGKTYKVSDDKGNLYISINNIEERGKIRPFEIFLNSNGENSEYMPWYRAMAKLISAVMRRIPDGDISFIVNDLKSIYADKGYFRDGKYIQSHPQLIGMILEEHMHSLNPALKEEIKFSKCPECGDISYSKEGGCGKCLGCGYSSCG